MNPNLPATEDESHLGPAMQALEPRARRFVCELFINPGNAARAARTAGYGVEGQSKATTYARIGHRLLSQARIVAAIEEESRRFVRALAPSAVRAIREVLADVQHKDRLKAARTVLERIDPALTRFEHEVDVNVSVTGSDEEGLKLLKWLRSLSVPREQLETIFGCNGLPRIERMLDQEETKTIEGSVASE